MLEIFGPFLLAGALLLVAIVSAFLAFATWNRRSRRVASVFAGMVGLGVLGAVLSLTVFDDVFASTSPRPDMPVVQPSPPVGAATWRSVEWREAPAELPAVTSQEQMDRAVALAATEDSVVAVGSNNDVMHYVGRIWSSADGTAWDRIDAPMLDGLELVDVAADGRGFVAVGTRGGTPDENPVTVVLRSDDGTTWTEVESVPGAWAAGVAGGPLGFIAWVQVDAATDLLVSADGGTWRRVEGTGIAGGGWISDVAADAGGWIAAGTSGTHAVVLRSADGVTWQEDALPAAAPIGGVETVSAYQVVPGRWSTLLLGLDTPPCDDDPDWCGHYQAAWSWTADTDWQRLPKDTSILRQGFGVRVEPAGDAGFMTSVKDGLLVSADGWKWTAIPGGDVRDVLLEPTLARGDALIGAGDHMDDFRAWFGVATIRE